MKISKVSAHHIRFDNGQAIKITPASFRFKMPDKAVLDDMKTVEFSEPLVFTDKENGCHFEFGNLPYKLLAFGVEKSGASSQAAIYWQGRNVLELEM